VAPPSDDDDDDPNLAVSPLAAAAYHPDAASRTWHIHNDITNERP
jgi:hypothetical protein